MVSENGLLLNPSKTEAALFGTRAQREKISTTSGVDVAGSAVPLCDDIKLLGVTLDAALTIDHYITEVLCSCNYHTRALQHIRPLLILDADAAETMAYSTVAARLDSNMLQNYFRHGKTVADIKLS